MIDLHEHLWRIVKILPTDYSDYGGQVERWSDPNLGYPDCACGCRWFLVLEEMPMDWGVCAKPDGPRCGLLTFEHQTGEGCFELGEPEQTFSGMYSQLEK